MCRARESGGGLWCGFSAPAERAPRRAAGPESRRSNEKQRAVLCDSAEEADSGTPGESGDEYGVAMLALEALHVPPPPPLTPQQRPQQQQNVAAPAEAAGLRPAYKLTIRDFPPAGAGGIYSTSVQQ